MDVKALVLPDVARERQKDLESLDSGLSALKPTSKDRNNALSKTVHNADSRFCAKNSSFVGLCC